MLEEGELRLEDVHVKYDGIISKTKEIKDKSKTNHLSSLICL